jgi:hypothetical protein
MSNADRQRLYRYRKRHGIQVIKVEVDLDHLDALVDFHFLPKWDDENPDAVADAVKSLLDRLTDEHQRRYT